MGASAPIFAKEDFYRTVFLSFLPLTGPVDPYQILPDHRALDSKTRTFAGKPWGPVVFNDIEGS